MRRFFLASLLAVAATFAGTANAVSHMHYVETKQPPRDGMVGRL